MNKALTDKLKNVLTVEELITFHVALNLLAKQSAESGLGTRWIELAKELTSETA